MTQGRKKIPAGEMQRMLATTQALFTLAENLERTLHGGTLTAARIRLEGRVAVGAKVKDGQTWYRYARGKSNAGRALLNRVAKEIYRLQYGKPLKGNSNVPGRKFPTGVPSYLYYGADRDKNLLAQTELKAEKESYPMPPGLSRLAASLDEAACDPDLAVAMETARTHRHHYSIARDMLNDLMIVLGDAVIRNLLLQDGYEDMHADDWRDDHD